MIIIEGPDQIGKTTAARTLAHMMAEHMGSQDAMRFYRHMGKPAPTFDHTLGYMNPQAVVQDRFHLGSLVYGLMLGRGEYPTHQQMLKVQRWLRWTGCLTVIMYGEAEWFREKLTARDELYSREQIIQSNQCFSLLSEIRNHGEPFADVTLNVTRDGYPTGDMLNAWFAQWKASWCG